MSRRRGRANRVKIKDTPNHIETYAPTGQQVTLQVHRTVSQVKSNWNPELPTDQILVPHAINVNIFPRYKS